MDQAQPTNAELAKMFFNAMIKTSTHHYTILEQKKLIEACKESIAEAFAAGGSLQGFKVPRFYSKYYSVLEAILRDGVEKTGEALIKSDVATQRCQQFKGIPGSASAHVRPESTPPSWDDGIKRLES